MKWKLWAAATVATVLVVPTAQARLKELRIGFLSTLSGGAAIIGKHQVNGFKLGLENQGWTKNGDKLGGIPTKVLYGDDQVKPDVGRRIVQRWLRSDRVQIVAGIIWSNVLMAVERPVTRARRILISTNAGASPMAGRRCSPYFISTSWQNDQTPEAMGRLLSTEGLKTVYLMAPNYQAGKDMLAGFRRYYKGGKVVGQSLFKIGESDYQADLSKVQAVKPQAVFIFAPGGMGVAFMKQWAASGVGKKVKLFTVFTVDWVTLPAIKDAALGTFHTAYWAPDLKNAANKKFVKDYIAKYHSMPSYFAAQAYDAPGLIAAALKKVGNKLTDAHLLPLAHAMRRVHYASVRGPYRYNVNGFPIENFYKRAVVMGADGKPTIKTVGTVFTNQKDSYWRKCPKSHRY
jgi:branched-chain amino acid transport system substrate-binding protein